MTHAISLCHPYDIETECIIWETDKPSLGNCSFVFLMWKGPLGSPSYIVKGDAQPYMFLPRTVRSLNNNKKKRVLQSEQCSSLSGEGRWPMWPFSTARTYLGHFLLKANMFPILHKVFNILFSIHSTFYFRIIKKAKTTFFP